MNPLPDAKLSGPISVRPHFDGFPDGRVLSSNLDLVFHPIALVLRLLISLHEVLERRFNFSKALLTIMEPDAQIATEK